MLRPFCNSICEPRFGKQYVFFVRKHWEQPCFAHQAVQRILVPGFPGDIVREHSKPSLRGALATKTIHSISADGRCNGQIIKISQKVAGFWWFVVVFTQYGTQTRKRSSKYFRKQLDFDKNHQNFAKNSRFLMICCCSWLLPRQRLFPMRFSSSVIEKYSWCDHEWLERLRISPGCISSQKPRCPVLLFLSKAW